MMDLFEMTAGMKKGEEKAIGNFYELYMPKVYHIAQLWMKNHYDAEDVSHDVFIEVLDKIHQYDPEKGSLDTWLAIRTRSRCIDQLRKQQRIQFTMSKDEQLESMPLTILEKPVEESVLQEWQKSRLKEALEHIPHLQSRAIKAVYYEGKTHKEASDVMAKPLGTLKSLIRYGVKNLRKQLLQEPKERSMIS